VPPQDQAPLLHLDVRLDADPLPLARDHLADAGVVQEGRVGGDLERSVPRFAWLACPWPDCLPPPWPRATLAGAGVAPHEQRLHTQPKGGPVPKYVMLYNYTDQGIKTIKGSPDRIRRAAEAFEQLGGKLLDISLTMGQYDLVATFEAPDDETVARFALTLGSAGNVRTTTLRAFPLEEFERIAASIE
jgi:uncharacterized protein with GYD domain